MGWCGCAIARVYAYKPDEKSDDPFLHLIFWVFTMESAVCYFAITLSELRWKGCVEHPDLPSGGKYDAVGWLVWAVLLPVTVGSMLGSFDALLTTCTQRFTLLFVSYITLALTGGMYCAEIALRKSPVRLEEENVWSYGQAIPMILLYIPLSALFREYTGLGLWEWLRRCNKQPEKVIESVGVKMGGVEFGHWYKLFNLH